MLEYSGDLRTRPMKDRVREAVFNLLGTQVKGTHAIDLFAGTGALAFEALSRGASRATLIERHHPTCKVIERNAKVLSMEGNCEIVFGDAFLWVRKLAGKKAQDLASDPWLVFCSPPYEFYVSRRAEMLALIETLWNTAPAGSLVMVEADERFEFRQLPQAGDWDVRSYPPAVVGIGRKVADSSENQTSSAGSPT